MSLLTNYTSIIAHKSYLQQSLSSHVIFNVSLTFARRTVDSLLPLSEEGCENVLQSFCKRTQAALPDGHTKAPLLIVKGELCRVPTAVSLQRGVLVYANDHFD